MIHVKSYIAAFVTSLALTLMVFLTEALFGGV